MPKQITHSFIRHLAFSFLKYLLAVCALYLAYAIVGSVTFMNAEYFSILNWSGSVRLSFGVLAAVFTVFFIFVGIISRVP